MCPAEDHKLRPKVPRHDPIRRIRPQYKDVSRGRKKQQLSQTLFAGHDALLSHVMRTKFFESATRPGRRVILPKTPSHRSRWTAPAYHIIPPCRKREKAPKTSPVVAHGICLRCVQRSSGAFASTESEKYSLSAAPKGRENHTFSISTQMPPARMALCMGVNQSSFFQCRPSDSQSSLSSRRL